jgi:hypothetical protein
VAHHRQVDLYQHPKGQPLARARIHVEPADDGAVVTTGEGTATPSLARHDAGQLAGLPRDVIRGQAPAAAQAVRWPLPPATRPGSGGVRIRPENSLQPSVRDSLDRRGIRSRHRDARRSGGEPTSPAYDHARRGRTMPGSYQVDPDELVNGSTLVRNLHQDARSVTEALSTTLLSMVSAVGTDNHLSAALKDLEATCSARMGDLTKLLDHITETLAHSGRNYQLAEERCLDLVKTVVGRAR